MTAQRMLITGGAGFIYSEAYGEGFEDMQRRVPCLDKARRLLGYRPTRGLDVIIKDVAADLKSRGDN